MSKLDPVVDQGLTFIFTRCQVRLDGADLVVTVPAPFVDVQGCTALGSGGIDWSKPSSVGEQVTIDCAPGKRVRCDQREYGTTQAYAESVEFRFRGGVTYGRVPGGDRWMFVVQAVVRSIRGLSVDWTPWDSVRIDTSSTDPERPAPSGAAPRAAAPTVATTADVAPLDATGPHLPYP